MDDDRYILMQRYEVGRLLGQGTFAKVYYARNIKDNQSVAIKMIDKEKVLKIGISEQIKREISVMRLVKHPNIVELFEVMASRTKIYFIMEYVKCGELFDKVAKGKLQEDVARKLFQQLISAVDYCHSRSVYHRDLKLENLLLDENENLKVTDFGLSARAESNTSQDGLLRTTCGTPAYVAPEVISTTGYDGAKADIWSCGVILYVLLAGYLPFHDTNLMEMYRKIGRGEYKYPSWFPQDVRRLLSKILDPNPITRIAISKIRENKWFRKGYDEQKLKEKVGIKEDISLDVTSAFSTSGSTCTSVNTSGSTSAAGTEELMDISHLNAFDIISLSAGLNLSSLFTDTDHKREARFTSNKPASMIISTMHEMAKLLKLKVMKKENGVFKMEAHKDGRKGPLAIDAEIYEVNPAFYFVEIKKSNGDTVEYQRLLNDGIRPALKDIVWAWQDHNHFKLEQS